MSENAPREIVSRRARPAKAPLSQGAIVTTGLELLSQYGLSGLSLRKVATALDTGPASLYVYVSNLDELHSLILERALGDVVGPQEGVARETGDWRGRLKSVLRSYLNVLTERPGLAQLAMNTVAAGPHALRLTESLLEPLVEGGVDPRVAAWAVDLLLLQVTGTAAGQSASHTWNGPLSPLARAYVNAPARDFPLIHTLHVDLSSGGLARFDWALDVLIDGIAHSRPAGRIPGTSSTPGVGETSSTKAEARAAGAVSGVRAGPGGRRSPRP
ncbi:TetR/AcrR family transcriptional regulator [Streptomyces sp. NPDC088725]|uniref:TetR/AcrR family transcriptional regulator n=1 Tax=Streptomyces sp. NPDC088725 TaxID=3365873 RepID=UPI0037F5B55E